MIQNTISRETDVLLARSSTFIVSVYALCYDRMVSELNEFAGKNGYQKRLEASHHVRAQLVIHESVHCSKLCVLLLRKPSKFRGSFSCEIYGNVYISFT